VSRIDDLLASIIEYSRAVQIARIGDDFLDPPPNGVNK